MQIELNRWDSSCRILYVTFEPNDGRRKIEISVFQDVSLHTLKLEPATINWPAIGMSEPAVAKQFGKALVEAVRVAKAIEKFPLGHQLDLEPWRKKYRRTKAARKTYRRPVLTVARGKIEVVV